MLFNNSHRNNWRRCRFCTDLLSEIKGLLGKANGKAVSLKTTWQVMKVLPDGERQEINTDDRKLNLWLL